jgi:hypothetical protein
MRYLVQEPTCSGVILDRSIYSDIVFADKNFTDGNFSRAQYDEYLQFRGQLLSKLPLPTAIVYLDVTPEQCRHRILSLRKRDCEEGIPLAYLQGLDECYRTMLREMGSKGVTVLSTKWDEFGETADVAASVKRAAGGWVSPSPEFLAFIGDDVAVSDLLRMPATAEEEAAAEAAKEKANAAGNTDDALDQSMQGLSVGTPSPQGKQGTRSQDASPKSVTMFEFQESVRALAY